MTDVELRWIERHEYLWATSRPPTPTPTPTNQRTIRVLQWRVHYATGKSEWRDVLVGAEVLRSHMIDDELLARLDEAAKVSEWSLFSDAAARLRELIAERTELARQYDAERLVAQAETQRAEATERERDELKHDMACIYDSLNKETHARIEVERELIEVERELIAERDEAVAWIRVVGEELASGGDRTVTLAVIRALQRERDRMRDTLLWLDAQGELGMDKHRRIKQALGVPYPEFCSQPALCAGRGSCPRDPTCAD